MQDDIDCRRFEEERPVSQRDDVLVWVDLEMTGLEPETCAIVQMAMILTDHELEELAEPVELTVWQPESVLGSMSPFVRAMHEKSGLVDQIRKSEVDLEDAERQVMTILTAYCKYRTGKLAGNSIWQDRRFLNLYLPAVERYVHYRMIDVSTIKELAETWYGAHFEKPSGGEHTALFDIRQSIAELRFYREKIMK